MVEFESKDFLPSQIDDFLSSSLIKKKFSRCQHRLNVNICENLWNKQFSSNFEIFLDGKRPQLWRNAQTEE